MKNRFAAFLTLFLISCADNYTPKPRAFFKINLPDKSYERIDVNCNFSFEKPIYSTLKNIGKKCLYNLEFSSQNGVLHITYLPIKDNLSVHIEQSRSLAYKHNMIADAISETVYINEENKVYGLLYDFDGNTATSIQFYLTDSINHFFRGALYFNTEVTDSILPINNFLKKDIKKLIESFRWESQ